MDTGFGYSQILPILLSVWKVNTSEKVPYGRVRYGYMTKARCYYEAIEQPELHLHPALQAKLINAFAQLVATENNRKIKNNLFHLSPPDSFSFSRKCLFSLKN